MTTTLKVTRGTFQIILVFKEVTVSRCIVIQYLVGIEWNISINRSQPCWTETAQKPDQRESMREGKEKPFEVAPLHKKHVKTCFAIDLSDNKNSNHVPCK